MPATRRRRIVRRAVMALAVVVLLLCGWLMVHGAPEIARSRALRLGMTEPEVAAVMGVPQIGFSGAHGHYTTIVWYYGESRWEIMKGFNRLCSRLGLSGPGVSTKDWPVAVHYLTPGMFVFRIERGGEIGESPPP